MKKILNQLVVWSVKNHWLYLGLILFSQWLTGQVMGEPERWGFLIPYQTARSIHSLTSKIIMIFVIGLVFDKLYLWLKSKGKI